jgi:hypothetical protein
MTAELTALLFQACVSLLSWQLGRGCSELIPT